MAVESPVEAARSLTRIEPSPAALLRMLAIKAMLCCYMGIVREVGVFEAAKAAIVQWKKAMERSIGGTSAVLVLALDAERYDE